MDSEEDQCISTEHQLSHAAPEDVQCSPTDTGQERVSSDGQTATGSPGCGLEASGSLGKQSYGDYHNSQGVTSEDHPAVTHCVEVNKVRHQKDRRLMTECHESHVQVKLETVECDEPDSSSGETRKWVVCDQGLVKVELTDSTIETSNISSEDDNEGDQQKQEDVSEARPAQAVVERVVRPAAKSYTCAICDKSFTRVSYLSVHERIHTGVKPFVCTICGKSFINSSNLNVHDKVHSGLRPYPCKTCGKSFTTSSNLKVHERIHTVAKSDACDPHDQLLVPHNSHELVHALMKSYTCSTCGKVFTRSSNLNIHERIHACVKPYTCGTCGKTFTRSGYLNIHERIHTGDRPYACVTCGKLFKRSNDLNIHERIHSGVKPYTCATCGKSFAASTNLSIHERVHTGEKPYSCTTCGKSFTTSSSLKKHDKLHTHTKP